MRVSVDIPEQHTGMEAALVRQFAEMQRQLMGLVKDQTSSKHQMHSMMMEGLADQQAKFVKAMESLMAMVSHAMKAQAPTQEMIGSLQRLKQSITELPGDLKQPLNRQYQEFQKHSMGKPMETNVTVEMPKGLTNRLDALETALVEGMHRSRSRTFGSNY